MKKKKTGAVFVAPIVASWLVSVASTQAGIMYSGSISNIGTDATMVGNGSWSSGSSLSWVVEQSDTTNEWTYDYTLNVPQKDISHFILGLCPTVDGNDLSVSGSHNGPISYGTFGSGMGSSNPGIPGDLYGMKIDTSGDTTNLTFSLVSSLAPSWGDFYAKDGKDPGKIDVYMYNSGFGVENLNLAADGNSGGYVLVPCSSGSNIPPTVVPEPSSAAGLALLLLGGVFFNRRRR